MLLSLELQLRHKSNNEQQTVEQWRMLRLLKPDLEVFQKALNRKDILFFSFRK